MASHSYFLQLIIIIFLLSFCNFSFTTSTNQASDETDYDKWISWNVRNHKTKQALSWQKQSVNGAGSVLDDKLRIAEMNKMKITVSQDGSGDFRTIKEAVNSIPLRNTRRVILMIKPGIYREKIFVPKTLPFITFLGDASNPPTITGNDTASVAGKDGRPLKTFQSATVAVDANYFVAINIKFENSVPHVIGSRGGQAVAVRISGTKAAFYNCSFYGDQDTLYDHKGLHYFNNCFIQGSVDFIFGYGRSLYENCYLNSIAKKKASLTAQKRSNSSLESGFSFKDSVVTGSSGGLVYLGRAWGDYSRVVFSYTFMDKVVLPQGWSDWGDQKRDARVYYGEYKCSGPGANLTGRVAWARILTDEEAQPFLGTYYVEGDTWLITP
ncbi:Pectinesterase, catalytic [Corchorus olitorius]|uniref:Pectinesterase n=1 Tax=Corchorus olitorius TaxID=93759 RepID=A0A1R3KYK6_9ROSI|nr:Pectinesterase, catalytic [Corchorus olitorius]